MNLPIEIAQSGIHPIYSCTAHYVEMLLKAEVPLVFSAFRMSGFTPSQVLYFNKIFNIKYCCTFYCSISYAGKYPSDLIGLPPGKIKIVHKQRQKNIYFSSTKIIRCPEALLHPIALLGQTRHSQIKRISTKSIYQSE